MGRGQAHGKDREYQVLCSEIISRLKTQNGALTPYERDGIDVPFDIAGTRVSFDVALRAPEGDLVVVECKRWNSPVKQDDIFAFAKKVESLREKTGVQVAGIFIAKKRFQAGALKVGKNQGIEIAVCGDEGQAPDHFSIMFKRYDPKQKKATGEGFVQMGGAVGFSASLMASHIKKDGTSVDLGDLKKKQQG